VGSAHDAYSHTDRLTAPAATFTSDEALIANGGGGVYIYRDYASSQLFARGFPAKGAFGKERCPGTPAASPSRLASPTRDRGATPVSDHGSLISQAGAAAMVPAQDQYRLSSTGSLR
jgi:hypothetical protein